MIAHDDVIKWKHFPCYWPFVRGIHRSPVNSRHKGQWRGALMFSLICVWINGWVNNREADDLRRYRAHYDVTVMIMVKCTCCLQILALTSGPFYQHGSTPIPAWIGNYMQYEMWDEITYPSSKFNGAVVGVWEWICYFIQHFTGLVIIGRAGTRQCIYLLPVSIEVAIL